MHAFLFIGETEDTSEAISNFAKERNIQQTIEFEIKKIDEVREFIKETNLSFNQKTLYIVSDFDKASETAQNAMLKRLEEPQSNLIFALTAKNENLVIPTILSRCVVKNVLRKSTSEDSLYLTGDINQDFSRIEKIKSRNEAIEFLDSLLTSKQKKIKHLNQILKTKRRIEANSNFSLALCDLIIYTKNN